jgi:RHS repeat-associated protein
LLGDLDSDFLYAGYFAHARSGIELTTTRAYNPKFGRWLSRDLIGYAGGINLYGYVQNNPSTLRDPSGLIFTTGGMTTAGNSLWNTIMNGNPTSDSMPGTAGSPACLMDLSVTANLVADFFSNTAFGQDIRATWAENGSYDLTIIAGEWLGGGFNLSLQNDGFSFTPFYGFVLNEGGVTGSATANFNKGYVEGLNAIGGISGGNGVYGGATQYQWNYSQSAGQVGFGTGIGVGGMFAVGWTFNVKY